MRAVEDDKDWDLIDPNSKEKVKTVKCKKESKRGCNGKSVKCITHDLWDDLEIHINSFFEKNTLKDIIYRVNKIKQRELNQ